MVFSSALAAYGLASLASRRLAQGSMRGSTRLSNLVLLAASLCFYARGAGQLGLRWRDATGAAHEREQTVSAERDRVFVEPEGLATGLELDFGALDGRVLEVRGRRTP